MEPKDQTKEELKNKRKRPTQQVGDQHSRKSGSSSGSSQSFESGNPRVRIKRDHYRDSGLEDSNGSLFKKILGAAGLVAGGALLFKAAKGSWSTSKKAGNIQLYTKQKIKRSRQELYAYWRNLENLPNFMSHIKEVREIDEKRSKWTAEVPGGLGTIEWEAMIEQDQMNKFISWRSIADSDIENAGEVRFKDAPGGRGTIVETTISYRPPAGKVGEFAAELLNPAFEKVVKKDLEQFKKHMEQGGEERSELFL